MYNKTINEFIKLSASKEPAPGGGGVSALVGALAASLTCMSTNLSIGKKKCLDYTDDLEKIRNEATILSDKLLECINEDAKAFYPLSKAYKLPKDSDNYVETLEKCLLDAANSPLNIMELCCNVIDLDSELSKIASKLSISDVATSLSLSSGALKGAYINVLVNTRLMNDKNVSSDLEKKVKEMLDIYIKKADVVYKEIEERL